MPADTQRFFFSFYDLIFVVSKKKDFTSSSYMYINYNHRWIMSLYSSFSSSYFMLQHPKISYHRNKILKKRINKTVKQSNKMQQLERKEKKRKTRAAVYYYSSSVYARFIILHIFNTTWTWNTDSTGSLNYIYMKQHQQQVREDKQKQTTTNEKKGKF